MRRLIEQGDATADFAHYDHAIQSAVRRHSGGRRCGGSAQS
jgi:hypothetical protein